MPNRTRFAVVAVTAFLACSSANAGRPLQTEDAGVLDRGDCELELAGSRERNDMPTISAGRGQFGCGIGLQSQLAVFAGRAQGGGERADVAGFTGKTYLRELTDEQTGVTLAWSAGVVRPRGGGFERDALELRAVVTHPVGAWLLHGNIGWARNLAEHQDSTVWGAAVERLGLVGPLDAMFEFFGVSGEKPWANAGLRWNAVPGKVFLDGSYGRQTGGAGATLTTIGLKLAF